MRLSLGMWTAGLVVALWASGFGSPGGVEAGGSPTVAGPTWHWVGTFMNDDSQILPGDPARYTLQIREDGSAAFRLDCNRGSGQAEVGDRTISIAIGPSTLAACPPDTLAPRFARDLQEVNAYLFDGADLIFMLPLDTGIMRFTPIIPERQMLHGSITYRERIALPPGAMLDVRLEDTSLADAPAILIARQQIRVTRQVPIEFTLAFDPAAIDPRNTYTLRASITDPSGRLLFTTTSMNPVLTRGNPSDQVELVLSMVARTP